MYRQETGYPVSEEDRGTGHVCTWPARLAMTPGGPASHAEPWATCPKWSRPEPAPSNLPVRSLRVNLALLSPWSGRADATFCKHFSVFYLARILVSDISPGSASRAKWGKVEKRAATQEARGSSGAAPGSNARFKERGPLKLTDTGQPGKGSHTRRTQGLSCGLYSMCFGENK